LRRNCRADLLPLVAANQIAASPEVYGLLLGGIGAGAIGGSLALGWLGARLGPDRLVAFGTLGTTLALFLFAAARDREAALCGSLVAGACWVVSLTTLFVSAQVVLPDAVRGRGLAMLLTVIFGAMTIGAVVWGQVAEMAGQSAALSVAGLAAALVIPFVRRWKLQTVAWRVEDASDSVRRRAPRNGRLSR
jgi:MFS family permease